MAEAELIEFEPPRAERLFHPADLS
jgi:hypothetical protein